MVMQGHTEMKFYKRKQESKNKRKERKHALDQENGQEKKKVFRLKKVDSTK